MLRFASANLDFLRVSNKFSKLCSRWSGSYEKSFQYQILEHFRRSIENRLELRDYEVSTQIRTKCRRSDKIEEDLKSIFDSLFATSFSRKIRFNKHELMKKDISELDSKCSSIMTSLDQLEILYLLLKLFRAFSIRLPEFKFYDKSMIHLIKLTEYGLMSDSEIVQLLYFSIMKKTYGAYFCQLEPMLPNLNNLELIERCIVALSYFKTSSKLSQCQVKSLEDALEKESESLANDPLLLVSICKAVRISGPSPDLNLKNLGRMIIQKKGQEDFRKSTHVLSLFAEARIFEKEVVDYLSNDCMRTIENDGDSHSLRLKDVDRFLWSISRLYWLPKLEGRKLLTAYLKSRYQELRTKDNLGHFVRSLVSLMVLQCEELEPLIKHCFDKKVFIPIFQDIYHWKIRAQFQLLTSLVELEMDIEVPHQLQKKFEVNFEPSRNLMTIGKIGSHLIEKGLVQKSTIERPVGSLGIPGLTVVTKGRFLHIDVLDESTCLKNTLTPSGLMQVKLRLIPQLGYNHILIDGNTLNCIEEAESILEQKIKEILDRKKRLMSGKEGMNSKSV